MSQNEIETQGRIVFIVFFISISYFVEKKAGDEKSEEAERQKAELEQAFKHNRTETDLNENMI